MPPLIYPVIEGRGENQVIRAYRYGRPTHEDGTPFSDDEIAFMLEVKADLERHLLFGQHEPDALRPDEV